ncbi:hypothetical protein DK427_12930 [Methylobacterium radiodurans]|uniref:Helix-turn-helix domain-containing protein n=1 Tax=Methylobacterium radiodurans TaxID=2202828 RepID=A0A2U8VT16_9HYPH|nr:hypothetical protein DK427_12930 [Methylobacterium radiodurans]
MKRRHKGHLSPLTVDSNPLGRQIPPMVTFSPFRPVNAPSEGVRAAWLLLARRTAMRPDILTPADVAIEWGCSEKHVRNMIHRGELGHFRLGGKLLRIPRSAVEQAECARQTTTPTPSAGSAPTSSPEANASSSSARTASAGASGSARTTKLRLVAERQRSMPRP